MTIDRIPQDAGTGGGGTGSTYTPPSITADQIVYGAHNGSGDFAFSSGATFNSATNNLQVSNNITADSELIAGFGLFIPNDSTPTVSATDALINVSEPSAGSPATITTAAASGDMYCNMASTAGASPQSFFSAVKGSGATRYECSISVAPYSPYNYAILTQYTPNISFRIYSDNATSTTTIEQNTGSGIRFNFNPRMGFNVETKATGFTTTFAINERHKVIAATGTLATGTVKFHASPYDGQVCTLSSTQDITALTLDGNGKTVSNGVTTLTKGPLGSVSYIYESGSSTWYPV